jgi:hypothetical protein
MLALSDAIRLLLAGVRVVHFYSLRRHGLGDNTLQHSAAMEYPFTKGRHANMSAVVISQAANRLLTPTINAGASHVLFGRLNRTPTRCWPNTCSLERGRRV